jgi:hypothetical protein
MAVSAVLAFLLCRPATVLAVARRLPTDFHPFIGNVVSMAVATAVIVTALFVMPGFG